MDFEEFLWATGNDMLMDLIRKMYAERKPMGQAFHRQAMDAFRLYMIVGGMPQAVKKYVETKDFDVVNAAKRKKAKQPIEHKIWHQANGVFQ